MALTVQTNNAAVTALKYLNANTIEMNKALERLSSGFRVNSAADDASGYAIASKLASQGEALKAAALNISQAIAMVKMADAGVNEIQNMIVRIRALATQAASANNAGELAKLDAERIKLETAIDKIANSTKYNGVALLNNTTVAANTAGVQAAANLGGLAAGSYTITVAANATAGWDITVTDAAGTTVASATGVTTANGVVNLTDAAGNTVVRLKVGTLAAGTATMTVANGNSVFQVGADNNADNQIAVNLNNSYTTVALGLGAGDLLTQANAQAYIDTAKAALDKLIQQRADLGATQNQLAYVKANLATSIEQVTAAVSTIRDADMAAEMANFTKSRILVQAGTAMLAQANQTAQNVLALFR